MSMRVWLLALTVIEIFYCASPSRAQENLVYTALLLDPQVTLKSMFPKMDSFAVRVFIPARDGSPYLFQKLALRGFGSVDAEFETIETPYTFYLVKSGVEQLGLVLGINQRGAGKVPMQLFVALNSSGQVQDVYIQKLTTADVKLFNDTQYRSQFRRFSLKAPPEEAMVAPPLHQSTLPVISAHHWVLRGIRVALFISQHFYYNFSSRSQ